MKWDYSSFSFVPFISIPPFLPLFPSLSHPHFSFFPPPPPPSISHHSQGNERQEKLFLFSSGEEEGRNLKVIMPYFSSKHWTFYNFSRSKKEHFQLIWGDLKVICDVARWCLVATGNLWLFNIRSFNKYEKI